MSSLKGVWVHPADGEGYPVELRMTVGESNIAGITYWETVTDYGAEFGKRVWQYVFPRGARRLMFTLQAPDGSWSPLSTMADEWWVPEGNPNAARDTMRRFFETAGWRKAS